MAITINMHYSFKFLDSFGFSSLNGIYRVDRSIGYNDIINEEIDLYKFLYSKVDKSPTDLETDVIKYVDDIFYKLSSMYDDSVIWIPYSLIGGYPNPNVKEYPRVMLTTDLGVFDEPATLTHITRILKDNLRHLLGLEHDTNSDDFDIRINPHTAISVYNTTWMEHSDYEEIKSQRGSVRDNDTSTDSKDYYAEYLRVLADNSELEGRIVALEELVALLEVQ